MLDKKIWGERVQNLSREQKISLKNHEKLAFGEAKEILQSIDPQWGLDGSGRSYTVTLTVVKSEQYECEIEKEFIASSPEEAKKIAQRFICKNTPNCDDISEDEWYFMDEELEYVSVEVGDE